MSEFVPTHMSVCAQVGGCLCLCTPYVGLTPKIHGRHTLTQVLFLSEN